LFVPLNSITLPANSVALRTWNQVLLGSPRLGEDDGLLLEWCGLVRPARLLRRGESSSQGRQQDLALRVLQYRLRQPVELLEVCHLAAELRQLFGRQMPFGAGGVGLRVRVPLVGQLVGLLPVVGQVFGRRFDYLGSRLRSFKPRDQSSQRGRDRVCGRGKQLAEDQRHELALAGRQGVELVSLQVLRDQLVETLLVARRHELLHQGMPVRVLDVLQHLPPQRALTDEREPLLQTRELSVAGEPREPRSEALKVAEGKIVDHTDQPVELQERVLKRRGREQHLRIGHHGVLDRKRDLAGRLVDVPEPVRLVDDDQVPRGLSKVGVLRAGELVRAENDRRLVEGVHAPASDSLVEGPALQDQGGQVKLVRQLLRPLLAQVRRDDHEQVALSLGPLLGEQQARFDRLPETDLVGEDSALRKGASEREQGRLHLMRVQVDLRVGEGGRELFHAVGGTALGQLVREILSVEIGDHHGVVCAAALSRNRHRAFTSRIWSGVRQLTSRSCGLQTSTASARALEIATFSRFRE
jgi:hypothetical protein